MRYILWFSLSSSRINVKSSICWRSCWITMSLFYLKKQNKTMISMRGFSITSFPLNCYIYRQLAWRHITCRHSSVFCITAILSTSMLDSDTPYKIYTLIADYLVVLRTHWVLPKGWPLNVVQILNHFIGLWKPEGGYGFHRDHARKLVWISEAWSNRSEVHGQHNDPTKRVSLSNTVWRTCKVTL